MINTSITPALEPTSRISPSLSPLRSTLTSSPHPMTSPHSLVTSSPLMVSSANPFLAAQFSALRGFQDPLTSMSFMATAAPNQRTGSDKWTQTASSLPVPPPAAPGSPSPDPSMFCNVLCNMLVDRIKDTLQEAMKSYSTDTEKVDKMKGIVSEALNSADLDKKLSIVSVQSLMHRHPSPMQMENNTSSPPTMGPATTTALGEPALGGLPKNPLLPDPASPVSDYINRLSFIYGLSRPSMFNPYVKSGKGEGDDQKENALPEKEEEELKDEPKTTAEQQQGSVNMEVDSCSSTEQQTEQYPEQQGPVAAADEDINIVDDIEDEVEQQQQPDSDAELNKSFEEQNVSVTGDSTSQFPSPSISHPITPIPLNLSPNSIHEKMQSSLASNGFIDPAVQYELQKLLLSAAIAQGNVPTFSPSLLPKDMGDPRSDIPVMIPSSGPGLFDKREYSCHHCDATFSYSSKLRAHMICVHSIKSYQCRQCRKSFLDKEEYVKHLDLHPQRKFQCDKCPSSFDKQHQLSLHYRSHTNEKPYRCQICQRQFAVNDALIRHMRIHTGERPYACNVCGKRFAQKSGLTYHSYLHTGNRPYKCQTCGQGFVHRQALKQHLMKNHLNEQVGRILNSNSSSVPYSTQSSSGLTWEKESMVTAEAMKRAFSWETKEQSSGPFKLEGMAS